MTYFSRSFAFTPSALAIRFNVSSVMFFTVPRSIADQACFRKSPDFSAAICCERPRAFRRRMILAQSSNSVGMAAV